MTKHDHQPLPVYEDGALLDFTHENPETARWLVDDCRFAYLPEEGTYSFDDAMSQLK